MHKRASSVPDLNRQHKKGKAPIGYSSGSGSEVKPFVSLQELNRAGTEPFYGDLVAKTKWECEQLLKQEEAISVFDKNGKLKEKDLAFICWKCGEEMELKKVERLF